MQAFCNPRMEGPCQPSGRAIGLARAVFRNPLIAHGADVYPL